MVNPTEEEKNAVIDTDSEGYRLLEKQYPLPKPIEIIEDKESRAKLIKAQEYIIQLQDKLNQAQSKIAQAEAMQLLLDDKQKQLENAEQRIQNLEQDIRSGSDMIDGLRNENSNLKDNNHEQATEIARLKNRGLIARLFNS